MRAYRRMTWTTRLQIEALYNTGHSTRYIAHYLGYAPSSIWTEIQHGLYDHLDGATWRYVRRYSAQIAQEYSERQATSKGVDIKLGHNYAYAQAVADQIAAGRSPAHIVHSLRADGLWTVSVSTLYRYIDKGYIPDVSNRDLREKSKRKPSQEKQRAKRAPKGKSIETRPRDVFSRSTFGHWEMDSVIGKAEGQRESFLTFTERLTRFEVVLRVNSKTTQETVSALENALSKFPIGTFKTLTCDNGSEFQDAKGMEALGPAVFYCHPYCSSERGSNERANRILRRWFPKGQSLKHATQQDCDYAAHQMNTLRRRILDWHTPEELFLAEVRKLDPSFNF